MIILMSGIVFADKVIIFNFEYDNGVVELKDQIIKQGYYPDRKLAEESGYECQLADKNQNNVYSFNFELPVMVFTDVISGEGIEGSVEILDKTEFSFVTPYSDNLQAIICYNPNGYQILKEDILLEELSPGISPLLIIAYLLVGIIGFVILVYFNRKKK